MRLNIVLVGGRSVSLSLDEQAPLTLEWVRRAVARAAGLHQERLKLVKGGQPVVDEQAVKQLRDGGRDSLTGRLAAGSGITAWPRPVASTAANPPRAPPFSCRHPAGACGPQAAATKAPRHG